MSDAMTDRRGQPLDTDRREGKAFEDIARRHTVAVKPPAQSPDHMTHLKEVALEDVAGLERAERQYGSSWKRRGGVGAFMMLARKWDRLETALKPREDNPALANGATPDRPVAPWDIFGAIATDQRAEGIIDDIRDLRRYLLLVESEMRARGKGAGVHRDNTGHPAPFGYTGEDHP
jgi:hypothetical protein